MGQLKNQAVQQRSDRKSKGAKRYAGGNASAGNGTPIGWDEVDAVTVAQFVSAVTNAGDAVILGRTTDGGALSVCILSGDDKHREYFNDPEQANRVLKQLTMLAAM